ncbi:30S ribosomal protein S13 [Candidatus Pacearchaeota archaeon CG10_big_fil_rev_8_21_14_0_10_32_42]|nr:MAG: 30S ribosomal protein S13 [Candidatus Pacearchaeota archaeon CG10_big_fil_rev_8_21_14_0_10_32_42]
MEKQETQQKSQERIVRILSKDIEGKIKIYPGLTKIKGVSWTLSNATCTLLGIDKLKRIGELTDTEIEKITKFLKNPEAPGFILNRRKDPETGEDQHLIGVSLELKNEFDIKRLKKIKSYRGIRHTLGLPSRGQRTKSNFRKNRRKSSGIQKKGPKVEKGPVPMKGKK